MNGAELNDTLHTWKINYALHMDRHSLSVFWSHGAPAGCALALKAAVAQIEADTKLLRRALGVLDEHATQRSFAGGVYISNAAIALRERLGEAA